MKHVFKKCVAFCAHKQHAPTVATPNGAVTETGPSAALMSLVQSGTNLRPNLFAMALCMLHRCCTVKQIHPSLLACVLLVSNVFGGIVIDEEEVNGAL